MLESLSYYARSCSIMLTVITAVSYVISSINGVYSFELVALTVYTTVLWL